jgi:hypothetical protein
MPKGPVATMDTVGYVTEPKVKIDRAMAYWFANRVDQCIVIRDVKSFQYVTSSHQDDKGNTDRFIQAVKENLTQYLLQIFDTASVEARAIRENEGDKIFTLAISGVVGQDNKLYDLSDAVIVSGETYKRIATARANNNG